MSFITETVKLAREAPEQLIEKMKDFPPERLIEAIEIMAANAKTTDLVEGALLDASKAEQAYVRERTAYCMVHHDTEVIRQRLREMLHDDGFSVRQAAKLSLDFIEMS